MNLLLKLNQYNIDNIYLCEPIKNNIISDGSFIRIIYSSDNFILNGVYLVFNLNNIFINKIYNKYQCLFSTIAHTKLILQIKQIEEQILKKCNITNKTPQFKLYEQLTFGNIKVFNEPKNNQSFILKISGIWETSNKYGITYKFLIANNIYPSVE